VSDQDERPRATSMGEGDPRCEITRRLVEALVPGASDHRLAILSEEPRREIVAARVRRKACVTPHGECPSDPRNEW